MRGRLGPLQRSFLAVVTAIGLLLMHGGVGQAAVCGPTMLPMQMSMSAELSPDAAMAAHDADGDAHDDRHQPADQPMKAHGTTMCVSAAISVGSDGKNLGSGIGQVIDAEAVLPLHELLTVSELTGWHPPAPDLISELRVIRQ